MIRITKSTRGVKSITRFNIELDSFIVIPGVTSINFIYTTGNNLVFHHGSDSIMVSFNTEADLERFFTQFDRDLKLHNILNSNNE